MSNLLMINKHGSSIPVYDINNDSRQIGYLNNREALAPTQNQNSVPDYLHLYYESGPLTIYAGEIVELDNDSEMRAAYHTRHFDYPF